MFSSRALRTSSSRSRSSGRIATLLFLAGRRGVHDPADRAHELGPAVLLSDQLGPADGRETVELRLLIRLAHPPLGLEPPALHESVQGGVERAGLDLEQLLGLPADGLADPVAVPGPPLEGPKDQHVQGALEELEARIVGGSGHGRRCSTTRYVERLRLVS